MPEIVKPYPRQTRGSNEIVEAITEVVRMVRTPQLIDEDMADSFPCLTCAESLNLLLLLMLSEERDEAAIEGDRTFPCRGFRR